MKKAIKRLAALVIFAVLCAALTGCIRAEVPQDASSSGDSGYHFNPFGSSGSSSDSWDSDSSDSDSSDYDSWDSDSSDSGSSGSDSADSDKIGSGELQTGTAKIGNTYECCGGEIKLTKIKEGSDDFDSMNSPSGKYVTLVFNVETEGVINDDTFSEYLSSYPFKLNGNESNGSIRTSDSSDYLRGDLILLFDINKDDDLDDLDFSIRSF